MLSVVTNGIVILKLNLFKCYSAHKKNQDTNHAIKYI